MRCPNCSSDENGVVTSLPDEDIIWRVRKCKKCSHEWETSEVEDERLGLTVKQEYDRRQREKNKSR